MEQLLEKLLQALKDKGVKAEINPFKQSVYLIDLKSEINFKYGKAYFARLFYAPKEIKLTESLIIEKGCSLEIYYHKNNGNDTFKAIEPGIGKIWEKESIKIINGIINQLS